MHNSASQPRQLKVTLNFALMVDDFSQRFPVGSSSFESGLPGILVNIPSSVAFTPTPRQFGTLIGGSSATPTALYATSFGSEAIVLLLNPLDPQLRVSMEHQRRARKLAIGFQNISGAAAAGISTSTPWHVTLDDTKDKKPCTHEEWFENFKSIEPKILQSVVDHDSGFSACTAFRVYIVVPEDMTHPIVRKIKSGKI